jgi:hypothetical protein
MRETNRIKASAFTRDRRQGRRLSFFHDLFHEWRMGVSVYLDGT